MLTIPNPRWPELWRFPEGVAWNQNPLIRSLYGSNSWSCALNCGAKRAKEARQIISRTLREFCRTPCITASDADDLRGAALSLAQRTSTLKRRVCGYRKSHSLRPLAELPVAA